MSSFRAFLLAKQFYSNNSRKQLRTSMNSLEINRIIWNFQFFMIIFNRVRTKRWKKKTHTNYKNCIWVNFPRFFPIIKRNTLKIKNRKTITYLNAPTGSITPSGNCSVSGVRWKMYLRTENNNYNNKNEPHHTHRDKTDIQYALFVSPGIWKWNEKRKNSSRKEASTAKINRYHDGIIG